MHCFAVKRPGQPLISGDYDAVRNLFYSNLYIGMT